MARRIRELKAEVERLRRENRALLALGQSGRVLSEDDWKRFRIELEALGAIFEGGGRESGEISGQVRGKSGDNSRDSNDSAAAKSAVPHDCLTREHDPDEWCPDCFVPDELEED